MATSPPTETFIYHSAHGDTNTKKGSFGDPYLVNPKAKNPVHPIKLPKGSVMNGITIELVIYSRVSCYISDISGQNTEDGCDDEVKDLSQFKPQLTIQCRGEEDYFYITEITDQEAGIVIYDENKKREAKSYPNSGYYYNEDSWQTGITEVYNDNGDAKFRPLTITRHKNIRSDERRDPCWYLFTAAYASKFKKEFHEDYFNYDGWSKDKKIKILKQLYGLFVDIGRERTYIYRVLQILEDNNIMEVPLSYDFEFKDIPWSQFDGKSLDDLLDAIRGCFDYDIGVSLHNRNSGQSLIAQVISEGLRNLQERSGSELTKGNYRITMYNSTCRSPKTPDFVTGFTEFAPEYNELPQRKRSAIDSMNSDMLEITTKISVLSDIIDTRKEKMRLEEKLEELEDKIIDIERDMDIEETVRKNKIDKIQPNILRLKSEIKDVDDTLDSYYSSHWGGKYWKEYTYDDLVNRKSSLEESFKKLSKQKKAIEIGIKQGLGPMVDKKTRSGKSDNPTRLSLKRPRLSASKKKKKKSNKSKKKSNKSKKTSNKSKKKPIQSKKKQSKTRKKKSS